MGTDEVLRTIRQRTGLSVRGLAAVGGVSPATVDRIEHRRVTPMATLDRIAGSVGYRVVIDVEPTRVVPLTREDRRSLAFHRLVAAKLLAEPATVINKARRNLATMRRADQSNRAVPYLDEWDRLLSGPDHNLVAVLLDPGEHAGDLRQVSPFAGVLTPRERAKVYPTGASRRAPRPA